MSRLKVGEREETYPSEAFHNVLRVLVLDGSRQRTVDGPKYAVGRKSDLVTMLIAVVVNQLLHPHRC